MEDNEYKHWSDVVADQAIELFGDSQVVCAGWSPSGEYHIGNSREAVTCNAIHEALKNKGKDSTFYFVVDDFDTLDKIPQDLKKYSKELRPYLGHPINRVPDFTGEYDSYAEYFASGAIKAMNDFGFDVEFVYSSENYANGKYDKFLRIYHDNRESIDKLFEEISGSALDSYVSVICQNCGNMKTPVIQKLEDEIFYYECISDRMFRGCEEKGQVTIDSHEWKLKWRLDWPARQTFLGVTVEPSGKDHSVAGGSVDTAIAVHEKILNQDPPLLERYGFITLKGMKMSGSKGGALPASKVADIMPVSAYLYLVYRSDLMKDINFNVANNEYVKLIDEFDDARRMFEGVEFEGREREYKKLSTAADLAMRDAERGFIPADVKFEELSLVYQTSLNDKEMTLTKFKEMGKIGSDEAEKDLVVRLDLVDEWLSELAPDTMKITFLDEIPGDITDHWDSNILYIWRSTLNITDQDSDSEEITTKLREYADEKNVEPKAYYQAFYQMLTGNSYGPNAANLVLALGHEELLKKLEHIESLIE